jgi:AAA family ATP:ADP antiporter
MSGFLARFTNIRRDEVASVLASALFFFCVLTALQIIRPARDALGMQRGIEEIRWLFQGTLVITLFVNPVFGFLVSRFRRMTFIAATYLFFAGSLVVFYAILVGAPTAIGERTGQVFYVWFSVFNLFATMVFWALMADRFTLEQSKRFFAAIAVGGTAGAIFGPLMAATFAESLGTASLLLVSAGFLVLALGAAGTVAYLQPSQSVPGAPTPLANAVIGGSAWEGLRAIFRSRYLFGIAVFALLSAVMATFIYFTRLGMVDDLGIDLDAQTVVFAQIDLYAQLATLAAQLLITGHIMRRLGVTVALALLPITAVLGFFGLAVVGTIGALIALDASFRAVQRGVMRPARETLFTIMPRADKYKAKAFIDTAVYRTGDSVTAWFDGVLGRAGLGLMGLASLTIPIAIVGVGVAVMLGRTVKTEAERNGDTTVIGS